MNNDARFEKLKKKVGGNREITGFEYTFGEPAQRRMNITPPGGMRERILAELEFALKLDEFGDKKGKFACVIGDALGVLEAAMERDGVLTDAVCLEAERKLLPLKDDAKAYTAILCGHAHIDMNWMWSYNETVAATLSTFGTMLDLMDQYPDFTFSQSQASVYRIVEEHDPELMERIRKRIKDGRWEITATEWVETDKNMPCGESLVNTALLTKKYFEKVWGVDPESLKIDFSPDTFGHDLMVPEIDRYTGVKYCYHCRGQHDGLFTLYIYKAPSGAELLMYTEPYWYNSGITPHVGIGLPELSVKMNGHKTGLIVYGVGDHGGGVTRRDVEKAIEMMSWPVFPNLKFGTFREFFETADTKELRAKLPIITHELNFLLEGCYTTQSRIKKGNRASEAKLIEAEAMSALANKIAGAPYHEAAFDRAWENVLFTHFHDILTGSCVRDSREYAMGLYQKALAIAETELSKSLRAIAAKVDTGSLIKDDHDDLDRSYGAGVGYGIDTFFGVPNPERGTGIRRVFTVFNTTAVARKGLADITVWDWAGDLRKAVFTDTEGNPVEAALAVGKTRYWDHDQVTFLVRCDIPAFSYKTVVLDERETESYPFPLYVPDSGHIDYNDELVLENEHLRAEFDMNTLALISLIDKADYSEKIDPTRHAGLVLIDTQDNGMSAWTIGKYLGRHPVTDISNIARYNIGGLRQIVRFSANVLNSHVNCEISLDKDSRFLRYYVGVDWNELSGRTLPVLVLEMPFAYRSEKCLNDIPMGSITRTPRNHDIPALTYCAALDADGGAPLTLMADTKYGYRFFGNTLTSTLINTAHFPDPDPERGHHDINLYVGLGSSDPLAMHDLADFVNRPLRFVSANPHKGTLPADGALASVDSGSAVITSVALKEGKLRVRAAEMSGADAKVSAKLLSGESVDFDLKPYSIGSQDV